VPLTTNRPSRWLTLLAFATVYIVWGTSYIGIRYAIQTIPPFLMTASRFLISGIVLIAWAKLRGVPWPTLIQWRSAAIVGFLLFVVNNGGIVWAEGHGIPSGVAAVLIATVPLWMVLLIWLRPGGSYPGHVVIGGLVLGFVGIILLASPDGASMNLVGVVVVLVAAFAWAYGSLYGKHAPQSQSPTLAIGAQLVCGGAVQLVLSLLTGELPKFDPAQVTAVSVLALLYLGIVSSVIAYSAFVWLMNVSDPAKVSTYAYVNPVVAVALGWVLLGEAVSARTIGATAIIILSVVIINGSKRKTKGVDAVRLAEIEVADAAVEV
jgi:drug/metabolite transporter (DMT)-like permease